MYVCWSQAASLASTKLEVHSQDGQQKNLLNTKTSKGMEKLGDVQCRDHSPQEGSGQSHERIFLSFTMLQPAISVLFLRATATRF